MFDFEQEIRGWRKGFRHDPAFEDASIADLELHLRDEFEAQKKGGLSDDDAFRAAAGTVGTAESLAGEYGKNRRAALDRRSSLRPSRFMPALIRSYFRVAARGFKRRLGFSFLNIAGLAAGMAGCILIMMWVRHEVSFDRFHAHAGLIHRVLVERTLDNTFLAPAVPGPVAPALLAQYPEITAAVRLRSSRGPLRFGPGIDDFYTEPGLYADPSLFQVFTFPLLAGDAASAMADPSSIIISESMAKLCFGDENPIGRMLSFNPDSPLRVTGVMRDVPANSDFRFRYVVPLPFLSQRDPSLDRWSSFQLSTYIRLAEGVDPRALNAKIEGLIETQIPRSHTRILLRPLTKLHLYGLDGEGPIAAVVIFSAVALFILLIACFNFVNLSTARASRRAREVGLRKTIGARRSDLMKQFLGESVGHSLLALLIAVGLVVVSLPAFNALTGKALARSDLFGRTILLGVAAMAAISGLLAGLYPALYLSGFQPVRVLRGAPRSGAKPAAVRRVLVVIQFAVSAFLLVATLIVSRQLQFIRHKDLGLRAEGLIVTSLGSQTPEAFEALKSSLKSKPGISAVTRSNEDLTVLGFETTAVDWEGKSDEAAPSIQIRTVDDDYLTTLGLRMKEGRFFSRDIPTDATDGYVINESAARIMNLRRPVGKEFALSGRKGRIIGVVRDFHFHSFHEAIEPLVLTMNVDAYGYLFIRLTPGRIAEGLAGLRDVWPRINPGYPLSYRFYADILAGLYQSESRMGSVIRTFATLALLIAGLGLFGLAAFLAEQKTKEIGIRKVAGASVVRIVVLLNGEFLKWVVIADLIGFPLAYFALRQWLRGFAYRTPFGPGVFALAAVLSLGIAGLSVAFQSIQAGRKNPIEALRFE